MKYLKLKFIMLILITISKYSFGQVTKAPEIKINEIIHVDTITKKPTTSIPFDSPFFLNLPWEKSTNPIRISTHRLSKRDLKINDLVNKLNSGCCDDESINRKLNRLTRRENTFSPCKVDTFYFFRNPGKANIYVSMPPLEPNSHYQVFIDEIPDDREIKMISNLSELISTRQSQYLKDSAFNKIIEKRVAEQDVNTLDSLKNIIYEDLNIPSFFSKRDSLDRILQQRRDTIRIDSSALKNLFRYSMECDTCGDCCPEKKSYDFFGFQKQSLFYSISNLISLISLDTLIINGYTTLNEFPQKEFAGYRDYKKRKENINSSINSLNNLIALSNLYLTSEQTTLNIITVANNKILLTNLISILNARLDIVTKLQTLHDNYISHIKETQFYFKNTTTNTLSGFEYNNLNYNLESRNAIRVTGDFGFVYYSNFSSNSDFDGLTPYLGFHINFRAMNENIPFSRYPNMKWYTMHHWSVFAGVGLISIAKENELDNFISKHPLIVGVGYKFFHTLRIEAGAVIFRKDDPNPLITSWSYAAAPAIGLSLHLSLKSLINGIGNLFTI